MHWHEHAVGGRLVEVIGRIGKIWHRKRNTCMVYWSGAVPLTMNQQIFEFDQCIFEVDDVLLILLNNALDVIITLM